MRSLFVLSSKFVNFLRTHLVALELLCSLVIIAVGAIFFHLFEGIGWYDSFYYTVITIAGVGYGDITPVTPAGKGVAIVLSFLGMPLYLIAATLISTRIIETMKKIKRTKTTQSIVSKVKALIIEDDKILFLKTERRDGSCIWDLPGGTIRFGERSESALLRRVIQEIHAQIVIEKPLGIWWWVDQEKSLFSICHTYLAHIHPDDKGMLAEKTNTPMTTEMICRIEIKDLLLGTIDIANESLMSLIREQTTYLQS